MVGLGYVGLPLAIAFGKKRPTVGYDLSASKVAAYREGYDPRGEVPREEFHQAEHLEWSTDPSCLRTPGLIIVAVPTPIDESHQPDLSLLIAGAKVVGEQMRAGVTVVFESTVYPGATEEVCVPTLEAASGLKWKKDFFVAYSPERINPGDPEHSLTRVTKVVAADGPQTLRLVANAYAEIIEAGIVEASSIAVAEAAKVIENTQRDLNIALMNELSIVFHRLGLDTADVLEVAATKWNFLPFRPGLVGGHCIGVDPYYLTYQAERSGYRPQVILAGRRINDQMAEYVGSQTVKGIIRSRGHAQGAKVLILGLTFKANCADVRNSKVASLVGELREFGCEVWIHDPLANPREAESEHGLEIHAWEDLPRGVAAIIFAVPHRQYLKLALAELLSPADQGALVMDLSSMLDRNAVTDLGLSLFRL